MRTALIAALVGLLVAVVGVKVMLPEGGPVAQTKTESAFERVKSTKVLRCGYVDYEPANMKDANTGELKGIFVDAANAMASNVGWKVEWVQSGGWGTFISDLEGGKYDAFCGAGWGLPPEVTQVEPVGPLYYSGVRAWVRADDHRFDNDVMLANVPGVTVAATDGSFVAQLAKSDFPNAKLLSLPETAPYSTSLLNVATNKADITFVEDYLGNGYLRTNPGSIRNITPKVPLRASPNLMYVAKGEHELRSTLQMLVDNLETTGALDKIIAKHEGEPGTLLRVQRPYRME